MVDVEYTDQFADWYDGLDEGDQESVRSYVELLEATGVALGAPYSSAIKGSKCRLRELRVQSGGDPIRVFYVFDPRQMAVLLIGGSKKGWNQERFYKTYVREAEKLYAEHLIEIEQQGRKKR